MCYKEADSLQSLSAGLALLSWLQAPPERSRRAGAEELRNVARLFRGEAFGFWFRCWFCVRPRFDHDQLETADAQIQTASGLSFGPGQGPQDNKT